MIRWQVKEFVDKEMANGLTLEEAINKLLNQLGFKDIIKPLEWYQQTIGGE